MLRWLARKIQNVMSDHGTNKVEVIGPKASLPYNCALLTLTVYKASGGLVVVKIPSDSEQGYSKKHATVEKFPTMHIIQSDKDLAEEIANIITMDSL